ncbi:MAG: GreA/GreB family elongation factor, partial [Clostridia bacterium]|nr:GreA/GreB family elongation factor [Clostridia bacterium]
VEWDEEVVYEIVGSNEADAINGRISDQAPIGRALMGKRAGDQVEVQAPNGTLHFKVLHVERTK